MGFDPVAFARTGNGAIGEEEKPEKQQQPEEFDPVAFALGGRDVLTPKARAAYGPDVSNEPLVRDTPAPSRGQAFMGELVQGATFGYADEIQGMANGNGLRDEMRRQAEANREAYPGWALAGGLTGGALMTAATGGLGLAGAGARAGVAGAGTIGKALASPVARAAVEGAVAGAGYSDADTIEGRLGGAAMGAAGGALVAKALPLVGQGIKRIVAGAPERVERKMIQDLVGSTNPSARNKLLGPAGAKAKDVAEVIRAEPEIKKALGDPQAAYSAIVNVSDRLDDEMSNVYRLVDQADPGLPAAKVRETASKYTDDLRKKYMPEIADRLDSAIEARLGPRAADGARAIPASDLRMLVSSFQRQAYEGGTVNPSVAKETSREFSMVLRNMLNDHVEDVATRNKLDVAPIRALNKRRSILANLEAVTERSATRDVGATKIAPFSLDNAERLMKSPGAAIGAVLSGNAVPYYGIKGAIAGARATDRGLARLVEWVGKNGGASKIPRSELLERAAKFGVSKAAAARLAEIKPAAAR